MLLAGALIVLVVGGGVLAIARGISRALGAARRTRRRDVAGGELAVSLDGRPRRARPGGSSTRWQRWPGSSQAVVGEVRGELRRDRVRGRGDVAPSPRPCREAAQTQSGGVERSRAAIQELVVVDPGERRRRARDRRARAAGRGRGDRRAGGGRARPPRAMRQIAEKMPIVERDRLPDEPARAELRHRGGARGRARAGVRGRRDGGPPARRAEPDRGRGDLRARRESVGVGRSRERTHLAHGAVDPRDERARHAHHRGVAAPARDRARNRRRDRRAVRRRGAPGRRLRGAERVRGGALRSARRCCSRPSRSSRCGAEDDPPRGPRALRSAQGA